LTTGRWHLTIELDGVRITADFREPIVAAINRLQAGVPHASDREDILSWWQQNAIMSANCQAGNCDHVVV
jgi:hypothetical protein